MKTHFLKSTVALLLVCTLAFSLTGCDSLDYREAVKLYNAGKYDRAAELFSELDDYEDSAALHTRSLYWAAITRMEEGHFPEALPRFQKLGNYADSTQRAMECTYQIAIAAFEAGNFTDAEIHFQELNDYRYSREYLRRISWQKLYDALCEADSPLKTELGGKSFSIFALQDDPNTPKLVLSVELTEDEDYLYTDFLTLTLTRDSTEADFTCGSDFRMDYVDGPIGSSQSGSGKLDITTCTSQTVPVLDAFEKTVTDNLGNTTTSTDPADSLMSEALAENMNGLMTVIPAILQETGITLSLKDIGFSAM